jgi:hypothetical protein
VKQADAVITIEGVKSTKHIYNEGRNEVKKTYLTNRMQKWQMQKV